jgi:DNA-binding transcriptional LysR family regulator
MLRLRVAFEPVPVARWGSLFHVLLLERPGLRLEWVPVSLQRCDRSPLDGADVALLIEPPPEPHLSSLAIDVSPMVAVLAVGHPLACKDELRAADVLPVPGARELQPGWTPFWMLDERRAASVSSPQEGLELVAAGRAIATFPESLADGLAHPGVISFPLVDAPRLTVRLVWRAGESNGAVHALVELARAMFAREGSDRDGDRSLAARAARGPHA